MRRGLNARSSSEEGSLDEGRNRRRHLQLNVPLRTGDVWTNGVVLNLQLQQRRRASASAELSYLWADRKCHSVVFGCLPINREARLGAYREPVCEGVGEVEHSVHLVRVPALSAGLEPLPPEGVGD